MSDDLLASTPMPEWLDEARRVLAAETGEQPQALELSDADVDVLLDIARIAAHDSGDRRNAPLLTYLVGLAHGRHGDRTLAEIAAVVPRAES